MKNKTPTNWVGGHETPSAGVGGGSHFWATKPINWLATCHAVPSRFLSFINFN